MKNLLIASSFLLLGGCAGLHVQWDMSYSTTNAVPQILLPQAPTLPAILPAK